MKKIGILLILGVILVPNVVNAEDKVVPFLDKILEDNELKVEIPQMFNYASDGQYIDVNNDTLTNQEYITNGLYSNKDEDGTTYYYRGDIENNYVQFGEYQEDYYVYGEEYYGGYYQTLEACERAGNEACDKIKLASKGDKMYWRIIRVNGDGSLRLLYSGTGTNLTNSSVYERPIVGKSLFNLNNDSNFVKYIFDGQDSFIKKEVDTWYINTLGSNPLYDDMIAEGKFCNDTSLASISYDGITLYACYERIAMPPAMGNEGNQPTFVCPQTNDNYRLKAGLLTADEAVFAGELLGVRQTRNFVYPGETYNYWTMTPYGSQGTMSLLFVLAYQFRSNFEANEPYGVRPVINISSDNGFIETGNGTADNPYVIGELEKNNYKGTVTIEEGSSVDDVTAFEENLNLDGVTWTSYDEAIARIENGKILGLKEGTTTITGVSSDGLTTYEIVVNVIKNPVTNSMIYVGIGVILILVLGTALYTVYRIKTIVKED